MKLFANWDIVEGKAGILGNDISGNYGVANQFLILAIVLVIFALLLVGVFTYYLIEFNKTKDTVVTLKNRPLIITTFVLQIIPVLIGIILLLFWSLPAQIFGTGPNNGDTWFATYLGLAIPGFSMLIAVIIVMWTCLHKYAVGFSNNKIFFISELIPYSKIKKIIKDTSTGNLYINFIQGKRALKKEKFSLESVLGQFILANISLTGHQVEELDQKAFVEKYESNENFDKEEVVIEEVEVIEAPVIVEEVQPAEVVVKKTTVKKTTTTKPKTTTTKKTTTTAKKAVKPKTAAAKKPVVKKTTTTKTSSTTKKK